MTEPVSILVANYKGGPVTELCVESIRRYTPEGRYRIIVWNDYDPLDTDGPYLRTARDRGWLELYDGTERLHHGGVLNKLWNEICQTPIAVNLDNDTQVKAAGWLDEITAPLADPQVVAVCDERAGHVISEQGYCPAFYRFWFAAVNMTVYRDMGGCDWRFAYASRSSEPYASMLQDVAKYDHPNKRSGHFNEDCVAMDPGSKFWVKVHADNPKGYRVVGVPGPARAKHIHHGHISHWADVPDDYDEWTRQHKPTRMRLIEAELRRVRCHA